MAANEQGYVSDEEVVAQESPVDPEAQRFAEENAAAAQQLHQPVKTFITRLQASLNSGNVQDLAHLYERTFPHLTNEYYRDEEWPRPEVVSVLANGDEVFLTFYRELYFRHLYSRLSANIDIYDRFDSYENYCSLFNYILNSEGPVPVELPTHWLWDIIDEFVWQFGSFAAWRSRPWDRTSDEIAMLAESPETWSSYSVLNVLYSLMQKSKISEILRTSRLPQQQREEESAVLDEYSSKTLYRMLGYFSILGLLRVHVLLGDYTLALKTLDDIDLRQMVGANTRFHTVHSAHVTVFYYVGWAYMQMQRYGDAIEFLTRGINHFGRFKRWTTGADQVGKQVDRMVAMVAMAHALAPSVRLDDWIKQSVQDKYGEQHNRMIKGGKQAEEVFSELFLWSCPKFVAANPPPYADAEAIATILGDLPAVSKKDDETATESDQDQEQQQTNEQKQLIKEQHAKYDPTYHHQKIFLSSIRPMLAAPDFRSFLKLHTTLDAKKLADLMKIDEESMWEELAVMKGGMRSPRWRPGLSLVDGDDSASENLDICVGVDNQTLEIKESKKSRATADYFIRHAQKTREQLDQIRARPLPVSHNTGSNPSSTEKSAPANNISNAPKTVSWAAA